MKSAAPKKIKLTLVKKIFILLSVLGFLLFFITGSIIFSKFDADSVVNQNPKYMIILGARVKNDGLSKTLKRRLDAAIPTISKDSSLIVIVSGGQGADEPVSEAEAMASYLLENGVSSNRIIKEAKSVDTYENLLFSRKLITSDTEIEIPVWLVTSNYHQYRAQYLSKQLHYKPYGIPCSTPLKDLPLYFIREIMAVTSLVFGNY
jgi:uncharacterized SAM-binding protein YcdF (DUF218 family)